MQPCGMCVNSFWIARGTAPLLRVWVPGQSSSIPAAGRGRTPAAPRGPGSRGVPALLLTPAPAALGAREDGQKCTKSKT